MLGANDPQLSCRNSPMTDELQIRDRAPTASSPRPARLLAQCFALARTYKVRGLDCAEEVAALKQAVGPLVGGADRLAFDVLNGRMTVPAGEVGDEEISRRWPPRG